jgi:hypothetical protein
MKTTTLSETSESLHSCTPFNSKNWFNAFFCVMFRHFSFCPYASFVIILYTFRTISWVCILEESDIDVPLVSLAWHETHSAHVVIAAESTAEDRVCTADIRPIMLTNSLRCSNTGKNWNEQENVTTQKCEMKPRNVNANIRIILFDHCM